MMKRRLFATSLCQNHNFLPVHLRSLRLPPPVPSDKCFLWRSPALLPAVTPPPRLNPGNVACAHWSAFLCLPGGWYARRSYKAHRPLLSPWMHYVNLQRGCRRSALALKTAQKMAAISSEIDVFQVAATSAARCVEFP